MDPLYKRIEQLWSGSARQYAWGDPLDVRYQLCREVTRIHDARVFDGACNAGIISSCLDASNEVLGVDINADVIEIARKLNPRATYLVGDLFDTSLRTEPFDVIILSNVLPKHDFSSEHEPKELIASIRDCLKPGGRLLLTTPNGENSYYRGKGKITRPELEALLQEGWNAQIYGWNPFPIQAGHILRYVPGVMKLLNWLMRRDIGAGRAVAFYVVATRL